MYLNKSTIKIKNITRLNRDTTIKISPKQMMKIQSIIKNIIRGITLKGNQFWIDIIFPKVSAVYQIGIFLIEKVYMSSGIMGSTNTRGSKLVLIVDKQQLSSSINLINNQFYLFNNIIQCLFIVQSILILKLMIWIISQNIRINFKENKICQQQTFLKKMGSATSGFIASLKNHTITIDDTLLHCSSSKLRQYYSSYRSICESFSININEFIQIFGPNQKSFFIFDTKKKGRIDAIQMFSALIVFSAINYEQKIKFLFQIFDFNEEGSLSYEALVFLLTNVCNSTYKIYSLQKSIHSKYIEEFLSQYFYEQTQVKLEKFIKWSRRIQQFMRYFNLIDQDFQPYYELKKIDKFNLKDTIQKCNLYKYSRNLISQSRLTEIRLSNPSVRKIQAQKPQQNVLDPLKSLSSMKRRDHLLTLNQSNMVGPKNVIKSPKISATKIQNTKKQQIKFKKNYRINNFSFDKKFIEALEQIVVPYSTKFNSKDDFQKNKQKQVNFKNQSQNFQAQKQMVQENSDQQQSQDLQQEEQTFNPSLQWLYGINVYIPSPVKHMKTHETKASNELLLYCLNNIIVVYYPKINIQKYYSQHKSAVTCFQVSNNKLLVASCEYDEDGDQETPQIHIWESFKRKTLCKFMDLQKGKVSRIKWTQDNACLISISFWQKWSIVAIDVKSRKIVLSTFLSDISSSISSSKLTQKQNYIDIIYGKNRKGNQVSETDYFIVYTNKCITYLFSESNLQDDKQRQYTIHNKLIKTPDIISMIEDLQTKRLISAHNDGKIRFWNQKLDNLTNPSILYSRLIDDKPVLKIIQYFQGNINILVFMDEQKIQIFNMKTKSCQKLLIPDTLYNLMLIDISFLGQKQNKIQLLIVSLFGDVIRTGNFGSKYLYNQIQEHKIIQQYNTNKHHYITNTQQMNQNEFDSSRQQQLKGSIKKQLTFKKYYQIFSLQNCNDYYYFQQYCLIAAGKFIYKINTDQQQLTTLKMFDNQIKVMSGFASYYAAMTGDDSRYIYIIYCDQIIQKIKLVNKIYALKLLQTHLILCTDKGLQIFTKSYDKYFSQQSKKVALDKSIPISITQTQNPFKFILITQQKEVFILEIKNNDFKLKLVKAAGSMQQATSQATSQINTLYNAQLESFLQITYPHSTTSYYPLVFYPQEKFLCLGLGNGEVRVWTYIYQLKQSDCECQYFQMFRHKGPVRTLKLRFYQSQLQLISMGETDGMVAVYSHKNYLIGDNDKKKTRIENFQKSQQINSFNNANLDALAIYEEQMNGQNRSQSWTAKLKDSQLSIQLNDDIIPGFVHKIMDKIIYPTTDNYQSLATDKQHARNNRLGLQIQHVYGFISEKIRNSIYYIHHYSEQNLYEQTNECLSKYNNSIIKDYLQNGQRQELQGQNKKNVPNLSFAKQKLLPLNQQHQTCKREIIYFLDCMVIIFSPQTKKQRIYSFHRNRVKSLQIHPNKKLVCSAQASSDCAIIHVWDTETLYPLKQLKTQHKGPIFKIQFSRMGKYILTLGGYSGGSSKQAKQFNTVGSNNQYASVSRKLDNSYSNISVSIEVIQWQYSNTILFRILLDVQIFTIKFNPYNDGQICVGGKNLLNIYQIQQNSIILKETVLDIQETITVLVYTSSLYGAKIQSDIILGTIQGQVALYICGKYIAIKKIHDGPINFISINELFKYKTILITGGEDGYVKIWDTKFNIQANLNIKDQLLIGKHVHEFGKFNFAAQSIDFYSCYPQRINEASNVYVFLIGTRSGHIIEVKISSEYHGLKLIQDQKVETIKQKLSLTTKVINSNNFSDVQSDFQMCGSNLIIMYAQTSPLVYMWNLKKKQVVKFMRIKGYPSIIKYDQITERLYIGYFKHAQVEIYKISDDNIIYQDEVAIKIDFYPDGIVTSITPNSVYIAISLISTSAPSNEFGTSNAVSYGNCVQIYECKQNLKVTSVKQKKQFQLKFRIQRKKSSYCAWMGFSSNAQQILLLFNEKKFKDSQIVFLGQIAQKIGKNSQYVMYSIADKKQKVYTNEQFMQINFCPSIKINYLYYEKIQKLINESGIYQDENLHPIANQMAQYKNYNLFGTTSGELFFVNSSWFSSNRKKQTNNILCKYFKISSTPITKIVVKGNDILLTSAKSNCVIHLKIKDDQSKNILIPMKDDFNEVLTEDYLEKYSKTIFPKRQYIYESRVNFNDNGRISLNVELESRKNEQLSDRTEHKQKSTKKRIDLELYSVIGRSALHKRNNIFVDLKQNIISQTGCNLIILKKVDHEQNMKKSEIDNIRKSQIENQLLEQPKYKQEFLKLDNSPFSTFAQISTLAMSQDRRVIFAGTNQENAKILMWNISTKTSLKCISLKGIMSIRRLNVSESNKYIVVIGLDKKGEILLFFISLIQDEILAAYVFKTLEQHVNDIIFAPGKDFSFLLCGNNYMTQWNYNGLLSFEHYALQNPPDFIQMTQKNSCTKDSKVNKVIFYSIVFLKQILITAGSDGYLYIWSEKKIIKKQNAHPKAAILCLYASKNSKILASGGSDGKAIVWKLSASSTIQNIYEFSIYSQDSQIKKVIPVRYHVQSVCISKNTVIVGSRAGEIYQFLCGEEDQMEKLKQQWKKGQNLILPAYDDDSINSCSFNTSSDKLFLITQMGIFSVFNLNTMEKIKQEKIDIGKSEIIKMIVCKFSPKIFIVLKNSILVYYNNYIKEEKTQRFRKGKQVFKPEANNFIKNAIISSNQKYLALLMASAQMDLYSIQLYDLQTNEGTFFKQFKTLDHIPTNVEIIDFSTDNDYLICKNTEDEETIIHLLTQQIVNPNLIQFELEWSDQAKKTSKNIRDILSLYGQENQLLKIVQVMNHSIIATDQMGSVRVFQYPVMGVKDQLIYYRFYVEHLNEVYICVLSQDSRILATVGRQDRSLILWRIKQSEDQSFEQ